MRYLLPLLLVVTACGASPAPPTQRPPARSEKGELNPSAFEELFSTERSKASEAANVELVNDNTAPLRMAPPYGSDPTDAFFSSDVDDFTRHWYGKHLAAMKEPSLWQMPQPTAAVVRFLWLRSFHKPMAVRVEQRAGTAKLTAIRLSGAGGYEPGIIEARRERKLTQADWERLRHALQSEAIDAPVPPEFGCDGSEWILEIRMKDSYRMVDRWSPETDGPAAGFRRFCELLLDLAGRDLIIGDTY